MNREEYGLDIDLGQIFRKLFHNIKYIALVTAIFTVMGFVYSAYFMTPVYEASAKMIVNTRNDVNSNITNDQLNSAKNLVATYAVIIRGRDVLNTVIDELDLQDTYDQLSNCISVKAVNNTAIMQITVRHNDWEMALQIAEKLLEIAPDMLVKTTEAGSIKPVDHAYADTNPVSPNVLKNTILMGGFGFVIACAFVLVIFLMDNTYKADVDIQKDLNLPVLGVIPAVESCRGFKKIENGGKGE